MQLWLPILVMAGYLSAAVLFLRVYQQRLSPLWALGVQVLSCQGHALVLIHALSSSKGLNLSVFNMVSVNAWFVATLSLFWLWRVSLALGGVLISMINALIVILPTIFVSYKPFPNTLSVGIWWHIVTSIAAGTLIALAFLYALLYGWLFRQLKQKRLKKNHSAISLVALERVMMLHAAVGFVLLSASLLTGAMFIENLFAQHLVHKTIFTFLAWLALAWTLCRYYIRRQRGMSLVYDIFLVFVLLLFGYVLSNIVLQFVISS